MKLVRNLFSMLCVFFALGLCAGCDKGGEGNEVGETGLAVSTDVRGNTDVVGIRFIVQKVNCDDGMPQGEPIIEDRPLEDQTIPGNIGELGNDPLDEGSAHLFADFFKVVEPGCYDVVTLPYDANGEPSRDCARAFKLGVEVRKGQTTEVFLINQCKGSDQGAIDIISALNHEPEIDNVYFDDSKFTCELTAEFCIEAHDVDGDPLELEVQAPVQCQVVMVSGPTGSPADGVRACFQVSCPEPGRVDMVARVYDLAWREGVQIRIEKWLALEGYPNESHAELSFHAYLDDCDPTVKCEESGPACNGVCPLDLECRVMDDGSCRCEEPPPLRCELSGPACNGECSDGYGCVTTPDGVCQCEPPPPRCELSGPACDGDCPVGQECQGIVGTNECQCVEPPPLKCEEMSAPTCGGWCPSLDEKCTPQADGACICVP